MAKRPDVFDAEAKVALHQQRLIDSLQRTNETTAAEIQSATARAEALLRRLGEDLPSRATRPAPSVVRPPVAVRPWEDLLADASGIDADVNALLEEAERKAVLSRMRVIGDAAVSQFELDWVDCAVAGLAASLAGLVDVLLVQLPRHPVFSALRPMTVGGCRTW